MSIDSLPYIFAMAQIHFMLYFPDPQTGGMSGRIQLFEEDGQPVIIPEFIRHIRRSIILAQVLGAPGSWRARWTILLVGLHHARWVATGNVESRRIVDIFNDIHRDPEPYGDSDEEFEWEVFDAEPGQQ